MAILAGKFHPSYLPMVNIVETISHAGALKMKKSNLAASK